jgi:hypothetical protein
MYSVCGYKTKLISDNAPIDEPTSFYFRKNKKKKKKKKKGRKKPKTKTKNKEEAHNFLVRKNENTF